MVSEVYQGVKATR